MIKSLVDIIANRFNEINCVKIERRYIDNTHCISIDIHYKTADGESNFYNVGSIYFKNEIVVNVNSPVYGYVYDIDYDQLIDIDEFVGSILCKSLYDK